MRTDKKINKKQTKTINFKVSGMQYIQQCQNSYRKDLIPHTSDQNLVTRRKMQYREQMTETTRKHQTAVYSTGSGIFYTSSDQKPTNNKHRLTLKYFPPIQFTLMPSDFYLAIKKLYITSMILSFSSRTWHITNVTADHWLARWCSKHSNQHLVYTVGDEIVGRELRPKNASIRLNINTKTQFKVQSQLVLINWQLYKKHHQECTKNSPISSQPVV